MVIFSLTVKINYKKKIHLMKTTLLTNLKFVKQMKTHVSCIL